MPNGSYIQTIEGADYGALSSVAVNINCHDCDAIILRFHNTTGGSWPVEIRDEDSVNSPGSAIVNLTVTAGSDGVIILNRLAQLSALAGAGDMLYLPGVISVDINAAAATTWSFTKITF